MRYWLLLLVSLPLVLNAQVSKPELTIDGQPDLQGAWNFGSNVALERADNLGTKEFYTPQEAAENLKKGFQGDRAVTGARTTTSLSSVSTHRKLNIRPISAPP